MKVTDEQIRALHDLAGDTLVGSPESERAWEIMGLCDVAIDGYAERRAAIEYARARGLKVTRVRWMESVGSPPADELWCQEVTADCASEEARWPLAGIRFEVVPGQSAVDAARDECAELIAQGWKPATAGGAS